MESNASLMDRLDGTMFSPRRTEQQIRCCFDVYMSRVGLVDCRMDVGGKDMSSRPSTCRYAEIQSFGVLSSLCFLLCIASSDMRMTLDENMLQMPDAFATPGDEAFSEGPSNQAFY